MDNEREHTVEELFATLKWIKIIGIMTAIWVVMVGCQIQMKLVEIYNLIDRIK